MDSSKSLVPTMLPEGEGQTLLLFLYKIIQQLVNIFSETNVFSFLWKVLSALKSHD